MKKTNILIYSKAEDESNQILNLLNSSVADTQLLCINNKSELYSDTDKKFDLYIYNFSQNIDDYKEYLELINNHTQNAPFIIIAGNLGEERIIELMKTYPADIVLWKNSDQLPAVVIKALDKAFQNNGSIFNNGFFRNVIEFIPDAIIVKSIKDNKYKYVNRNFLNIIDINSNHIKSKNIEDILPEYIYDFIKRNDDKLISLDKGVISYEDKVVINDKELWFDIQKIILKDEHNEPELILGIFVDTTIHKNRERSLEKSVNKFTKLFNNSPYPMSIVSSKDGRIMDINSSYLSLIGMQYEDVIGKTSLELGIWADKDQRDELFSQALNNEQVKNQEVIVKSKDGSTRTILMSIEQIKSDEDENLLIFMALDITDRKTFIEEIRRALAKEKELNMLKSRFISMISHEFRTPLTAIMLSTDLLRRYGNQWDEDEKLKHFDRIQKTVLRMTQLMESVLTIGRIEAGKLEFQPESMDLYSYCKSLAESIEFTASGKVKIKFFYSGECNDPMIDENLIGLTLSNLLSNAVKYSLHGKDVTFEVNCSEKYATFVVKDEGIGIPEKDQKNLFNTFYRASNVGSISGYGLGLNIVKRCVEAHKGDIFVQSKEQKGTTFTVKIPIS